MIESRRIVYMDHKIRHKSKFQIFTDQINIFTFDFIITVIKERLGQKPFIDNLRKSMGSNLELKITIFTKHLGNMKELGNETIRLY